MEETQVAQAHAGAVQVKLIDCDVHPLFRHPDEIMDYMPSRWRHRSPSYLKRPSFYEVPHGGLRTDSQPPGGGPGGSDPVLFDRQLLDGAGVDYAIHIDLLFGSSPDPDYDVALRNAMNRWLADTWLSKYNDHGRYRGSIGVSVNNVGAAVREIEEWAGHPYFVQIRVPDATLVPLGHPMYHPIWEAASRYKLPVCLHAQNGGTASLCTPVGPLRYYVEWHAINIPLAYMAHLTSLICEGVFDRFPELKVVLVEGGFTWLGPLLWRMEKSWDALRGEIDAKRRPWEYVLDHVRFTTQPVEEPDRRSDLRRLFDMMDAERILMFATDYPHWDYDDPIHALPRLSEAAKSRIYCENARELYRLPSTRPVSGR